MGENKFFGEVGNFFFHFSQNSWKTDKIQKVIIFLKTLEKPEILMVLTLQFDKNLLRYITFNLQGLSRTVLVYHFKRH